MLALEQRGSQELLTLHTVEHLLLGDIAALLIVLGLTGPLIAPILRIPILPAPSEVSAAAIVMKPP